MLRRSLHQQGKRKHLGRPNADPKSRAARREFDNGTGVLKTAKLVGLGTGTVQRLKREMAATIECVVA
jgi:hypothetical protein